MSPNPTLRFSLCAAGEFSFTIRWPMSHRLRFSCPGKSEFTLPTSLFALMFVSAFLGKMQHNFPLKQSHLDVACQPSMFTSPTS